jgi:hypothetical protein
MRYHFIITVITPAASGFGMGTFSSIYDARPGETRQDIYDAIYKLVAEKIGGTPNVQYFSLEPNDLPVA